MTTKKYSHPRTHSFRHATQIEYSRMPRRRRSRAQKTTAENIAVHTTQHKGTHKQSHRQRATSAHAPWRRPGSQGLSPGLQGLSTRGEPGSSQFAFLNRLGDFVSLLTPMVAAGLQKFSIKPLCEIRNVPSIIRKTHRAAWCTDSAVDDRAPLVALTQP